MAIYGIDLGTTNSCIASVNSFGQAEVHANLDSKVTTPSVVYFNSREDIIVGEQAKGMIPVAPQKVVECIKRYLRDDNKYKANNGLPYDYNPTEISAMILRKVVQDFEAMSPTGEKVKEVVITVPANFSELDKERTREAGIMAGLDVLGLLTEPQAAAYSYGIANQFANQNVLVFDLGGGTFDLCLLKITGQNLQALTTDGIPNLGGKDWDAALASYAINKINQEQNVNLIFNPENKIDSIYGIAMQAAERTKIGLTSSRTGRASYNLQIPGIQPYIVEITKEEFDNATRDLLEQAIQKTDSIFQLIQQKGWERPNLIVLVGGSSKMPQIMERLQQKYGINIRMSDPDTCVAKGAAFYASTLGEIGPDPIVPPVVPIATKSYGLGAMCGNEYKCTNIIIKDSKIPCTCQSSFSTRVDNQKIVNLVVYENDVRDMFATAPEDEEEEKTGNYQSKIIKQYEFALSGDKPAGYPLDAEFSLDESGLLKVKAYTPDGCECNFEVTAIGVIGNDAHIQQLQVTVN